MEQVDGDKQPYAAIRLDGPIPGIASASAFAMGDCAMVTMGIYLYGERGIRHRSSVTNPGGRNG